MSPKCANNMMSTLSGVAVPKWSQQFSILSLVGDVSQTCYSSVHSILNGSYNPKARNLSTIPPLTLCTIHPPSTSQILFYFLAPHDASLIKMHCWHTPLLQSINGSCQLFSEPFCLHLRKWCQIRLKREDQSFGLWQPMHKLSFTAEIRLHMLDRTSDSSIGQLTLLMSISSAAASSPSYK
jgi:hypothetical protein